MPQPNIVLIFMDDMGWRDLSCTGSTFYETPIIDALCREGMRFDRGYAACPVCSPSRASLMTGRHPARVGVTDWIDHTGTNHPMHGRVIDAPYIHHLPQEGKPLAQALREAGYATWHVGKWHLGLSDHYPEHYGFDVNIGGCWWGHPRHGYFSPYQIETLPEGPEGEFLTDRLTDEAIRLIETADPQKPFYLNLCHYAVHTPIQAKAKDIARFEAKAKKWGLDKVDPFAVGENHPTVEHGQDHVKRRTIQSDPAYAALLWNLDENVGRLVEALKTHGKWENTLLIFTSDNGGLATAEGSPTCNAPASEGKGWLYEGGTRVPLFAVWPGVIRPLSQSVEPVYTPDFYPTFLEAAGQPLNPGQHRDGRSFLPALRGEPLPQRPIFLHYPHYGNQGGRPGAAVLLGDYKLIECFEDDHTELYNVTADVGETQDLSQAMPEKAAELAQILHLWQKDAQAKFPQKNPDFPG